MKASAAQSKGGKKIEEKGHQSKRLVGCSYHLLHLGSTNIVARWMISSGLARQADLETNDFAHEIRGKISCMNERYPTPYNENFITEKLVFEESPHFFTAHFRTKNIK